MTQNKAKWDTAEIHILFLQCIISDRDENNIKMPSISWSKTQKGQEAQNDVVSQGLLNS